MKKANGPKKEWHASSAKTGSGDYYGTGFRQKVGKMRSGYMDNPMPGVKTKIPPKKLA